VAISAMQTGDPLPPQALFRGGADLTPRLGIDVLIDRNTGLLRTDRGISLFADPAQWNDLEEPPGWNPFQRDSRCNSEGEILAIMS
jgi:hypothetical protein